MKVLIDKISRWRYKSGMYFCPTITRIKGGICTIFARGNKIANLNSNESLDLPPGCTIVVTDDIESSAPLSIVANNLVINEGLMRANGNVVTNIAYNALSVTFQLKPNLMAKAVISPWATEYITTYRANEPGEVKKSNILYFTEDGTIYDPNFPYFNSRSRLLIGTQIRDLSTVISNYMLVTYYIERPTGDTITAYFSIIKTDNEPEFIIEGLTGDVKLLGPESMTSPEITVQFWAPGRDVFIKEI